MMRKDELEELKELAMENSKRGWGEDDIDNLEDEDYHHDTGDDEDPRPSHAYEALWMRA
jgi:hypothetical protein